MVNITNNKSSTIAFLVSLTLSFFCSFLQYALYMHLEQDLRNGEYEHNIPITMCVYQSSK